jgi:predicted GTPase
LNKNDLSTPPSANLLFDKTNNDFSLFSKIYNNESNKKITGLKKNDKKLNSNNLKTSLEILDNLDNFIKETFKLIDYNNELKEFRTSLDTLRENLLGRKIRISLIGNISVGKSTVLNCIIGENILPAKETECTYRGVIIRNKNIDNYELYRTKLITKGKGLD